VEDHLLTTYRGLHDLIGKGVPLVEIFGEMLGREVGASRGKGGRCILLVRRRGDVVDGDCGAGPRWRWGWRCGAASGCGSGDGGEFW